MRPTSRLDLVLVPRDPGASLERASGLIHALEEEGVLERHGGPGPRADRWIVGGFTRIHVDDPGHLGFWSNRQGGFTVRCPVTDDPVIEPFSRAMADWRTLGVLPVVPCPACGREHRADELRFRPEAAFGRWALVTGNAASATLEEEAEALVLRTVGPCATVLRRG